jgi:hypothetical protein
MVGLQDTVCVIWTASVGSTTPGGPPLPKRWRDAQCLQSHMRTASPKRGKKDSPKSD